jgi:peptidoglycan hydrolase CwlO-like protein
MSKLPKKFPEYSIMYKTLNKKIQDLKYKKTQTQDKSTINEMQLNIERYQKEIDKIKSIFPENFFDEDF